MLFGPQAFFFLSSNLKRWAKLNFGKIRQHTFLKRPRPLRLPSRTDGEIIQPLEMEVWGRPRVIPGPEAKWQATPRLLSGDQL